ncbi:MAG: radical SAM protein [Armatimonadota bacterium]|nr:radical SAM protein [Armatimonadota bacterium]
MIDLKTRIIDGVAKLSRDEERFVEELRRVSRLGKYVAPNYEYRRLLRMLEEAIEEDRPAIRLIRRMIEGCNEKYRRSLAALFVEHSWEGGRRRDRLEEELGVTVPSFIVISPLAACNLHCVGCYAGAYGDREPHLSYRDIERLLDEARSWGSRFAVLSGGEPTLFWDRIPGEDRGLRELCAQYDDMLFLMYTNGTLIDGTMSAEMADLGNVTPAISIEGFREQTDARRGEGTFDRVMNAMARLRANRVAFGASVTYTTQNWETVTSDEFLDLLIEAGCLYAWYFMYIPVGRDPDLSLTVTPEQRRVVAETTYRWLTSEPIFVADFWNSGPMAHGCIAGGRSGGYLHITHRGDICPCVFMMYSDINIHETDSDTPLMDAVRSDFFSHIREGQREKQNNPLAPCQIVDHPEVLKSAVEACGARDTQHRQRILTDLHEEIAARAAQWQEIADEMWTESGTYAGYAEIYEEDDGWLSPG